MKIRPANNQDFDSLAEIYVRAYNPLNIGENWDKKSA